MKPWCVLSLWREAPRWAQGHGQEGRPLPERCAEQPCCSVLRCRAGQQKVTRVPQGSESTSARAAGSSSPGMGAVLASWHSPVPLRAEVTRRAHCWHREANRGDFYSLHPASEFGFLDAGFTKPMILLTDGSRRRALGTPQLSSFADSLAWRLQRPPELVWGVAAITSEVPSLLKAPESPCLLSRAGTSQYHKLGGFKRGKCTVSRFRRTLGAPCPASCRSLAL